MFGYNGDELYRILTRSVINNILLAPRRNTNQKNITNLTTPHSQIH